MREYNKPVFQARHYETIANHLSFWVKRLTLEQVVDNFSDLFKADNPKFKPEQFKKACGSAEVKK